VSTNPGPTKENSPKLDTIPLEHILFLHRPSNIKARHWWKYLNVTQQLPSCSNSAIACGAVGDNLRCFLEFQTHKLLDKVRKKALSSREFHQSR